MPKELPIFKSHRFIDMGDHFIIEAPDGIGEVERRLLKHYIGVGHSKIVFLVRGRTRAVAKPYDGPVAWGDDTW